MKADKPNIILITADSLRADHCGFIDGRRNLTPTLDTMAENGVVFQNATAPGPRTPSSIPEIFTGVPFPDEYVRSDTWKRRVARVNRHMDRNPSLAEMLRALGYSTAAYTANPWTTRYTNFESGFDEFHEVGTSERDARIDVLKGPLPDAVYNIVDQWWNGQGHFSCWPTFVSDVVQTAKKLDPPYFLWVFLMDTHNPYIVQPQDRVESSTLGMYYSVARANRLFASESDRSYYKDELPAHVHRGIQRIYRDAVRSVDRFVDVFRSAIDDDALFLFHSDHGEAFNEHGTYGHKRAVYDENIRTPLLIHNADEAEDIRTPLSLRELPRMMTAYVTDGTPFTHADWTEPYTVSRTADGSAMAVRGQRSKYITASSDEFYDLEADPFESDNVIGQRGSRVEELKTVLESFLESADNTARTVDERDETDGLEPDEALRNRLESLGYIE